MQQTHSNPLYSESDVATSDVAVMDEAATDTDPMMDGALD